MIVELIGSTPHAEEVVALAAETCHTTDLPERDEMSLKKRREIIDFVKGVGHVSVLEHASFTFAIGGVSRALTHQLVRHRIASYSQQSQRYVDMSSFEFIKPESIKHDETASKLYEVIMDNLAKGYQHLVKRGVPMEDARYILPNAAATNITVTMNGRELFHFFTLRTCKRSQWEIQEMAYKMLELVKNVAPGIFKDAGASCIRGRCPEGKLCCGWNGGKGIARNTTAPPTKANQTDASSMVKDISELTITKKDSLRLTTVQDADQITVKEKQKAKAPKKIPKAKSPKKAPVKKKSSSKKAALPKTPKKASKEQTTKKTPKAKKSIPKKTKKLVAGVTPPKIDSKRKEKR